MKVSFGYNREDGKPEIDLTAETSEELDTLTLYAAFPEVHISWDRHSEIHEDLA